ncbi:MAG TPA: SRPBCC domain-containing protein [Anaerolineales bacterium]|nr:SRPBCC domain-containing protein [Anaerolineales bacterium]HLF00350.1 SRPBCC domain-containing protein [Anaerolineales bacterium]
MKLSGSVTIKAPRQKVWEFLTDPMKVSQCAPGVEKVEVVEAGKKFKATAGIGFGTVKARFTGDAEFVELDAPNRAVIKAHGNAPGSATDVASEMLLSDGPDGTTVMNWTADITILGQLASLAARMMVPVSQKLTEQFFECAKKKIES